ncbi:MAG: hypothetical protein ACTSQX_06570 [Candidatus Heimdallarchaeota archaeon]
MAISSLSKKIIGFVIISVFFLSFNIDASNASAVTLTLLAEDDSIEDEIVISPEVEPDLLDNEISANNFTGEDSVIGEAVRVAPNQLLDNEYYSTMDVFGILHVVWIQRLTHLGYSICYTHSNSSLGQEWIEYEILFRSMYRIYNIQFITDNNSNLHIFYTTKSEKYYRLYYLFRDPTNITNDFEILAETFNFELYDISTLITENNTLHLSWVTMFDDKKNDIWYSHLTYYSKNLTSQTWIGNQLVMHNDSNPIFASMSGTDEAIDFLWSKSDNYSDIQDLMITTYNLTTSIWNTSLVKSLDHRATALRCQTSKIDGVHIIYVKYGASEHLNYGHWLRNGTLVDLSEALNNVGYICRGFKLLEEPSGNLTIIFEDYYGTSDAYIIEKEYGNSTWSSIVQLTATDDTTDYFLILNPVVDIVASLFFLVHGSIYHTHYYNNDSIGGIVRLYYATQATYNPTVAADSTGVTHMICYHESSTGIGLLYQKLYPNSSRWVEFQTIEYLYHITAPTLIIDSNDTIHLFYAQYDVDSFTIGMFYMTKNATDLYWSIPKVIHAPNNDLITYYNPMVMLDENESIHVIWREYGPLHYEIYYTYKAWNEENFTTPELLDNYRNDTQPFQIDAIIDGDGTVHLTNSEYSDELGITMIVYRSKPAGGNWTDTLLLEASYDYLYKPMLVEELDGDIQLYCTESIIISWYGDKFETDIQLWELPYGSDEWTYLGFVLENCATAYFITLEQAPDGTLFMVYIDAIYTQYYWRDRNVENITVMFKPEGGDWSDPLILFNVEHLKTIPNPFYNHVTDQFINVHQYGDILYWYSLQNDTDLDGIGDSDEEVFCTDPNNPDTDGDGLSDGLEIEIYLTNPIVPDTDWDGLLDGQEVYFVNASDPTLRDTDRDDLDDGDEVLLYQSNPNSFDSDGDGLFDAHEVLILGSSPILRDTDGDGMDDHYEYMNGLNLVVDDSQEDPDDDLLVNLDEYLLGTDIYNNDTDGDYILDGEEVHIYKTKPLHKDSDGDTLTDWEEIFKHNTNPNDVDTDHDGFTDREEINAGTDPNDPRDNVRILQLRKVLLGTIIPASLVIIVIVVFEFRYQLKKKQIITDDEDEIAREEAALDVMLKMKAQKKGKQEE